MSDADFRDEVRGVGVTDEELVAEVRAGDDRSLDTLLRRFRGLVHAKACSYFLVGADHEDVVQEGMIGLYKAIRDFDGENRISFRVFAQLCVTRQIVTAVRTAARQKHGPLNDYLSFHSPMPVNGEGEATLGDVLPTSPLTDPAEQVVVAERVRNLRRHADAVLTDLEAEVLRLYLDDNSYQEIASRLGRTTKAIDNALQRIKSKLGSHCGERDAKLG